ncbi:MAG TPA: LysM peptidoglycan-binding domain-containing protein [Marmoricola sp.]|nr:LysM peptidoglycan-binding domain-containing protein [Marmoricola sp.]
MVVAVAAAVTVRLAAPVVVSAVADLRSSGQQPALLVASAITLVAAAALVVVTSWVAFATAWWLLVALRTRECGRAPEVHPLLCPWLVRALVGAALGTTALAAPAAAAPATPLPSAPRSAALQLPEALVGLPLPDRPTGATPRRAPVPAEAPAPAPAPPPTTPRKAPAATATASAFRPAHTVVAGDSLWSIAADHLAPGAGAAHVEHGWRALYDANRPRIGDDPDLIRPGTVLRLPPPLA